MAAYVMKGSTSLSFDKNHLHSQSGPEVDSIREKKREIKGGERQEGRSLVGRHWEQSRMNGGSRRWQ